MDQSARRAALILLDGEDASDEAIESTVENMGLGRIDAFPTRAVFKHMLRKRTYSGTISNAWRQRRPSVGQTSPSLRSASRSGCTNRPCGRPRNAPSA
jgi:hypothetical protein